MIPEHIFQFHQARDLATWLPDLPERYGTYLVLIRGGDRLLEIAGYFDQHDRLPYRRGTYWHLYTGAGFEWGRRVRHHLTGDSIKSNLRCTLEALELVTEAISRSDVAPWFGAGEDRLTRWLIQNALIGVCECEDPKMLEKLVLECTPSPLNIDQKKATPFAKRLLGIRAEARAIKMKGRMNGQTDEVRVEAAERRRLGELSGGVEGTWGSPAQTVLEIHRGG